METSISESWFSWFMRTLKTILFSPSSFFNEFEADSHANRGIPFGIICCSFGFLFNAYFEVILIQNWFHTKFLNADLINSVALALNQSPAQVIEMAAIQSRAYLVQKMMAGFFFPMMGFFLVYLLASAIYFFSRNFISKEKPINYDKVLHLVGYCQAPFVFALIPFVGIFIASVWMLSLVVFSMKRYIQTNIFVRVLVVLMPAMVINLLWGSTLGLLALNVPQEWVAAPFDQSEAAQLLHSMDEGSPNEK